MIAPLLALALSLASSAQAGTRRLAPGLSARELSCSVAGQTLAFREVRLERGSRARLVARRNKGARPDPSCPSGYGGPDIRSVEAEPGMRALAAANGNFFMASGRGWVSTGMIWSGGEWLALPRMGGGKALFVRDQAGGHRLRLELSRCGSETCVSARAEGAAPLATRARPRALLRALQGAFPGMTLAMQLNMDLGAPGTRAACPDESSRDWRCRSAARTLLCARADGSVSVLASSPARVSEAAEALRAGGSCGAGCEVLFNLDGGGSTQLALRDPKTGAWETHGTPTGSPRARECGELRPVDHYLVWEAY